MPETDTNTACQNPAVARCSQAWTNAYDVALPTEGEFSALDAASEAFRKAMPPLAGSQNIRDFIACVAYGMLNDILAGDEGTKLLYAAQVAHTSTPKPQKNSRLDAK